MPGEALDDLSGGPALPQFLHDVSSQAIVARQPTLALVAGGGTYVRAVPRRECAIPALPAIVTDFAGNGERRSTQPPCNG